MSSSLLDQHLYTISDIKLLNPPIAYSKLLNHVFRIEITNSDQKLFKSAEGKFHEDQVNWNEQITLDVTLDCVVNFKVLRKRKRGGTETIGEHATTMSHLLDSQKSSGIYNVDIGKKSQLSFIVKDDRIREVLDGAIQPIEDIHLNEGESGWSTFLTYFEIVKTAVDSVSSLNSYAKLVWNILSAIPEIIQTHFDRNSSFNKLLRRVVDIYKYITDANRLPTLKTNQSQNLKLLIQQTWECSYFIKEYADKNTAGKNWNGRVVNDRISEFTESFDRLFDAIQNSIILETSIVTLRISKSVDEIKDFHLLSEVPYAQNAGFVDGKKCLPGTRQKLINEILEWVDEDTSKRVLVLSGQAGMGKSAVAHTIAELFRAQNRLGSLFCFNRSQKNKINFLFSTIARDLADSDISWRQNLIHAIGPTAIRKSLDPVTQFEEMIIKPSRDIKTIGPVVIVVDALDESGDRTERKVLLNLLFKRSSELPNNYRVIITSRPEPDIELCYRHLNVFCKHMAHIDPVDTINDIKQFVSSELSAVAEILNAGEKNWRLLLAEKAQGLFQWANLACLYIDPTVRFGLMGRLRTVISKPTSSLYDLYHQILDTQPEFRDDQYFYAFQTIIGAIIVSRRSLSITILQALFEPAIEDVQAVLYSLHTLFIGVDDSTAEIRPIHTSLLDFFLSSEQKPRTQNRYYIDTSNQTSFTHACLRVMTTMLRFNICGLETSHLRNRDIPNLDSRVANAIPLHLSYACCFWAYHLEYSRLNPDLLKGIRDLMHTKLLYLFEALSLLGEVEQGRVGMQILKNQINDSVLIARAAEASQFALEFGEIMMESTPHLYLSTLPYISNYSFTSQQFIPQYPQLLSIDIGQSSDLQPEIKNSIVQRHSSAQPTAVVFSPQGRQIATGFNNGDFWVWDYVTGEILYRRVWDYVTGEVFRRMGPKRRATVAACSVVFSPNGELAYCCFRDGSILIWEAKVNEAVLESNEGLIEGECFECTISSDGRYVAFWLRLCSQATVICFYERETRIKLFEENLKLKDPNMMFSPSGRLFGFQSPYTQVLRLWDTQAQTFVSLCVSIPEPWKLEALTDNYLVARVDVHSIGNPPGAREVWDIRTSTQARRFEAESTFRGKVAFSTTGKYLLRSHGNEHWIWDISTGKITQRSVGRDGCDPSVAAISPDSKYMAFAMSGSTTTHVLAWDGIAQGKTRDLGEGNGIHQRKLQRVRCNAAWLKGRHLLSEVELGSFYGKNYLQILDTTKRIGLNVDFQVEINGRLLLEASPEDNHWSIAYVDESCVYLWNIDEREKIIIDELDGEVTSLAFSPTGDSLISSDSEGNIKIWDVRTRQLTSHGVLKGSVTALAFSPMGATFIVAYDTDENTFTEERECSKSQDIVNGPFTHNSTINSILIPSDNTYICVYSKAVGSKSHPRFRSLKILDRSTGANIKCFNTYLFPKISPNRRYIAWIAEEDQEQVELWDVEKGIVLYRLSFRGGYRLPFRSGVTTFEFSSDSRRISILCNEGKINRITVWDIETKTLAMRCVFNNFSVEQTWGSYMALYEDSLLLLNAYSMGTIWSLHALETMTLLYDDHPDSDTRRLIENYKSHSSGTTEVLKYALAAWNKASFSPSAILDKDGWMLGPHGELLFWVPQKMRKGLWYPCMTHMIPEVYSKLNFDKFVHGTRWIECRMQPKP